MLISPSLQPEGGRVSTLSRICEPYQVNPPTERLKSNPIASPSTHAHSSLTLSKAQFFPSELRSNPCMNGRISFLCKSYIFCCCLATRWTAALPNHPVFPPMCHRPMSTSSMTTDLVSDDIFLWYCCLLPEGMVPRRYALVLETALVVGLIVLPPWFYWKLRRRPFPVLA